MPDLSDAPTPAPAPPAGARPRCPRCGAALGRLTADAPRAHAPHVDAHPASGRGVGAPDAWYCGCCGLVPPAAPDQR